MMKQVDFLTNALNRRIRLNHAVLTGMWQQWIMASTFLMFWVTVGTAAVTAQTSCPSGRVRTSLAPPKSVYVISPRYSTVLETAPLLRWHQITLPKDSGTPTYTVQVMNNQSEVMWRTETAKTEVRYNFDGKGTPLVAGGEYTLQITVNLPPQLDKNIKYNEEELNQSTSFQVVTPQNKLFLENGLGAIPSNLLPQKEDELKSDIYASYRMNDAALSLLEKSISQGGTAPALARLHYKAGLLYGDVGLWELAQNHYEKGLSFAIQANQMDLAAAFRLQLVESYAMQYSEANNLKSIKLLELLLPYYEAKGDQFALEYVRQNLSTFRENIPLVSPGKALQHK